MNDINKYEYAVKAIRQAVEKSRYRATKAGNADSNSSANGWRNKLE